MGHAYVFQVAFDEKKEELFEMVPKRIFVFFSICPSVKNVQGFFFGTNLLGFFT